MVKVNSINEIIAKCLEGDTHAQKKLYNLYVKKMIKVCACYCVDIQDAEDACQDGFIKVFNSLATFRGDSNFTTWITRIMKNVAIDKYKRELKFNTKDLSELTTLVDEKLVSIDVAGLSRKEMYEVIETLPSGYRSVFKLYVIEGFTHAQIGALLNISEGTSKSQLSRAKKILKEKLAYS